jgi:hypothetical protein
MERFEDKGQLIDASATQRDPSKHRERRIAAKVNRLNQASMADARRRVALMETTIAGFEKTIRDLEGWIETERS